MNTLRELRQLRHVSFEDVAKACHIHYSRLKSIEKGQKASTLEWAQMCIYFAVTPQDLIPQDRSLWADVDDLMKAILKERERKNESELRLRELQAEIARERHAQQREFDKTKERELKVLMQRAESLRQQYDEEQNATFRKELEIPREYFNAATTILQGFIQSLRAQEGDDEILSASIRQQEAKLILVVRTIDTSVIHDNH